MSLDCIQRAMEATRGFKLGEGVNLKSTLIFESYTSYSGHYVKIG